ncbi:MAG: sigma-70 family RNA polymerase sigma factor [bacterium]|nr:sigma-70 family RNA polymerase sigma factor [bacterium]
MPPDPRSLPAEELLRYDGGLRDLVRSLAGEEYEDVVQDTWTAALAALPPDGRGGRVGAWMSVVARNFARRARRSRGRRYDRERAAARPEAVASTEETLELLELQARVARAVAELREPYRTAVLLRYTHELGVDEIARRTAANPATVRKRLERGRDLLRDSLRERGGDDWARALLVFEGSRRTLPTPWTPGPWTLGWMSMKKTICVGAGLLLVASTAVLVDWQEPAAPVPESDSVVDAGAAAQRAPALESKRSDETRSNIEPSTEAAVEPEPEPTVPSTAAGRVVDVRGQPRGGVPIGVTDDFSRRFTAARRALPVELARSASDGTFVVPTEEDHGKIVPGRGWVCVAAHAWFKPEPASRTNLVLVLAGAVDWAGVVVDDEDRPLADVEVTVIPSWVDGFPDPLDRLSAGEWAPTATDEGGAFRYEALPADACRLRFAKAGYEPVELEVAQVDELAAWIVLASSDEPAYTLSGWVLAPSGARVPGAYVGFGAASTRADAEGRYAFHLEAGTQVSSRDDLFAAGAGWRATVSKNVGKELLADPDQSLERDVVLAGEALAIAGRITDTSGAPVPGIHVYLWGERGLQDGRSAEEFSVSEEAEVLRVGGGSTGELRVWDLSDENGRYRLDGLLDKDYRLRLFDRTRFAAMTTEPVRAGTETSDFVLPADFIRERLAGRVVDLAGRPVEGVVLSPMLGTYLGGGGYTRTGNGTRVSTDEEGHFQLADISTRDLALELYGAEILSTSFVVAPDTQDEVEIQVERLCHFRVVLDGEDPQPASFEIHDASGEPKDISAMGGGEYMTSKNRRIGKEATRVLATGESAASLVLYRVVDGRRVEVGRQALALVPGKVTELRL